MNYIINNEVELHKSIEELLNLNDFPIILDVCKAQKIKTKKQLGFIFGGIVQDLLNHFNSEGQTMGEGYTERKWNSDDVKIYLYHNLIGTQYREMPDGEIAAYQKTISQMSREELSDFITKTISFIDNETDCILRPMLRYCWVLNITQNHWELLNNHSLKNEDRVYLKYLSGNPCIICGVKEGVSPHHIKDIDYSGTAQKSPDWYTVPVCHKHHGEIHSNPETASRIFTNGLSLETFCKLCYIKYLYKL